MAKFIKQHTLTLPGLGKIVRVRRPSVLSLIASDGFPQDLTVEAWKLVKKDKFDPDAILDDPGAILTWARLMTHYIGHVLVNPKIGPVSELVDVEGVPNMVSGEIALEDLSDTDKQFLFLFGNGAMPSNEELEAGSSSSELLEALRRFRERTSRGDAGRSGEAVRAETESVVGAGSVDAVGA